MQEFKGTKASDAIKKRYGIYPEFDEGVEKAYTDSMIGQMIYDARIEAGLSQKELAERVGTTQSVISRLEDADYVGHSLPILRRIALALKMNLEIRLVPINDSVA